MPNQFHLHQPRVGLILAMSLVALLLVGLAPAGAAATPRTPTHLSQFMWAIAGEESGWNYYARNPQSGAFGMYQIMPSSWRDWAGRYLHNQWADPNPYNQEIVARGQITALYRWLGSWRLVAHWWLTGSSDSQVSHWSRTARGYVSNVMRLMARAPAKAKPMPANPASANGIAIHAGDWRFVATSTPAWDRVGSGRHYLRALARGRIVKVIASRYGGRHHAVWLKVRLSNGGSGWVIASATLPVRAP